MTYNFFQERPKSFVSNPFLTNITPSNGGVGIGNGSGIGGQNYNTAFTSFPTSSPYSPVVNTMNTIGNQFNPGIEQKGTMEVSKYEYLPLYESNLTNNSLIDFTGKIVSLTSQPNFLKYSAEELRNIDYKNRKNGVWNNINKVFNSNTNTINYNTTSAFPFNNNTNNSTGASTNSQFNMIGGGNYSSPFTNNNNNPFNLNAINNMNTNNNSNPFFGNTNSNPFVLLNNCPFTNNNNNNNNANNSAINLNNNNNPFMTQNNVNPFNVNTNSNTPFNPNPINSSNNNPFISNSNPFMVMTNTNQNNNPFVINANSNSNIQLSGANQSIISNVSNIPLTVNPLSFSFGPINNTNANTNLNANYIPNQFNRPLNQPNQPNPSPLYYYQPYFDLKNNQFFIDNCSPIQGETSSDFNINALITKLNSSTINLYKENNKVNDKFTEQIELPNREWEVEEPPMTHSIKPFPSFENTTHSTDTSINTLLLNNGKDKQDYIKTSNTKAYLNDKIMEIGYIKDRYMIGNNSHDKGFIKDSAYAAITNQKELKMKNENYYQSDEYLREIEALGNEAFSTNKYYRPYFDYNLNSNDNTIHSQSSSFNTIPIKTTTVNFNKDKEIAFNSLKRQRNQVTPIKSNNIVKDQLILSPIKPNPIPDNQRDTTLSFKLNQPQFNNSAFDLTIKSNTSIEDIKAQVIQKINEMTSKKIQVNQITLYNIKGVIDQINSLSDIIQPININVTEFGSIDVISKQPTYPKITKYNTIPIVSDIMKMTYEQLSHVKNFIIYNEHGRIQFKEECDLNGVDIDSILTIKPFYVSCYLKHSTIPPKGTELNKPARIEIFSLEQLDDKTNEEMIEYVKETVKQLGGIYVNYTDDTLIFDVEEFKLSNQIH